MDGTSVELGIHETSQATDTLFEELPNTQNTLLVTCPDVETSTTLCEAAVQRFTREHPDDLVVEISANSLERIMSDGKVSSWLEEREQPDVVTLFFLGALALYNNASKIPLTEQDVKILINQAYEASNPSGMKWNKSDLVEGLTHRLVEGKKNIGMFIGDIVSTLEVAEKHTLNARLFPRTIARQIIPLINRGLSMQSLKGNFIAFSRPLTEVDAFISEHRSEEYETSNGFSNDFAATFLLKQYEALVEK